MQDGGGAKQQIVEKLKNSTNILVTVSSNPSVDELSAALGLTLILNKMDKHATAVFSGAIPAAINFLQPEKTFENTVDSLRDFIIALDKEKADRLRYKVDGDMVRIFITPYRTNISEKDLEFSQGDFNVETIVALGVEEREELDRAIAQHGRILHDATVVTVNTKDGSSNLGSVDWQDTNASSLCEMLTGLSEALQAGVIDEQIATALLTGIVAATDRFSNAHTKPRVMTMAAQLMAAGANQQLIATKLENSHVIQPAAPLPTNNDGSTNLKENASAKLKREEEEAKAAGTAETPKKSNDGEIQIAHQDGQDDAAVPRRLSSDMTGMTLEQIEQTTRDNARGAAERALDGVVGQGDLPMAAPTPTLADLERELKKGNQGMPAQPVAPPVQAPMPPMPPQPPVQAAPPSSPAPEAPKKSYTGEPPSWMGKRIEPPTMGGVLSATSEEAMLNKMQAEEEDRNRTILSHDHPVGGSQASPFTAPPAMPSLPSGPTIDNSLAPPQPVPLPPTPVAAAVAPNMPDQLPPVAAPAAGLGSDVDAARDAVNAALGMQPFDPSGHPLQSVGAAPLSPIGGSASDSTMLGYEQTPTPPPIGLPASMPPVAPPSFGVPTPPPLPDMNSLPPLPAAPTQNPMPPSIGGLPPTPNNQPDPFGPPPMQPGNDPGQFRIPGQ